MAKKSKKLLFPKATKGYGYCGVWNSPSNHIGWMCSPHVGGASDKKYPSHLSPTRYPEIKGERLYLCEIIIKPLRDKRGRPITKIIKE